MRSTRTLMALAAEMDWEIDHFDIQAAYLAGKLDNDTTYMELPEGYIEYSGKDDVTPQDKHQWVCKLDKGLYGLHQSGRIWYETLKRVLLKMGLKPCKSEPCVFYSPKGNLIITTYVDDLLCYGTRRAIDKAKRKLSKAFEVRDLGKVSLVQSIRVQRSETGSVMIDQKPYIEEILKEFQMENCRPMKTPMIPNAKYGKANEENELKPEETARFKTLIGSLLYLSTGTRPDIIHSVTYLSQFTRNPSKEHWNAGMHILR